MEVASYVGTTDYLQALLKAMLITAKNPVRRQKFEIVRQKSQELITAIGQIDPSMAIDMDDAGMRLTLDVVGLVRHAPGIIAKICCRSAHTVHMSHVHWKYDQHWSREARA